MRAAHRAAESVMQRARAALGLGSPPPPSTYLLTGRAERYGLEGRYHLAFALDGRFAESFRAPRLEEAAGFDGEEGWEIDGSGVAHPLDFEELAAKRALVEVLTGCWLTASGSPRGGDLTVRAAGGGDQRAVIEISTPACAPQAALTLERSTWLPASVVWDSRLHGPRTWTFADYRDAGGLLLPRRVTATGGIGGPESLRIDHLLVVGEARVGRFGLPADRLPAAHFLPRRPARVAAVRGPRGHLLVRPRIDGREPGWFLLDTGAGSTVIDRRAAAALGLEGFGRVHALGVGGAVEGRLCRAASWRLGPFVARDPLFVELDLGPAATDPRLPIVGIGSLELLAQAVVEVDWATPSLHISDPRLAAEPSAPWQPLRFRNRQPCLAARFEGDREALFLLDTGAAAATLIFHRPAVERLELLRGRAITGAADIVGIGGGAPASRGSLAWVELGGRRIGPLEVHFSAARSGPLADPYVDANLGGGLLREFRPVFNYSRRRVALQPA